MNLYPIVNKVIMKQSSGLTRRQFIRITASAGLLVAGGLAYGATNLQAKVVRVEETQLLLGSIANLAIISQEPDRARTAIRAALQQMSALEDVFSRFRPHSQLSQLNATGTLDNPHTTLTYVLQKAVGYGNLTGGAFDVTIEPVLQLYRQAVQTGVWPTEAQVSMARQLVDYRSIIIQDNRIHLDYPGMAVTLDGIAKGFIIDAGTDVLRQHGFDHIMVELGGDLHTSIDAGERDWRILVQQPDASATPIVTQLRDGAMATSGDYQYTFTADRRLHHIIDPASGLSPYELASASVIADTACNADALSTAVMIMGSQAGLTMIEGLPDFEALVITKQGVVHLTERFLSR